MHLYIILDILNFGPKIKNFGFFDHIQPKKVTFSWNLCGPLGGGRCIISRDGVCGGSHHRLGRRLVSAPDAQNPQKRRPHCPAVSKGSHARAAATRFTTRVLRTHHLSFDTQPHTASRASRPGRSLMARNPLHTPTTNPPPVRVCSRQTMPSG